jgi:heme exporter protein B
MAGMQDAALGRQPAREDARRLPGWTSQALIVLGKDLKIEARTGEVVVTSGFFAVLLVVLASISLFGGPSTARLVASGVIWLSITFAAVLALGRTWQREREEGALDGLLVAPLSRSALFTGKLLGILIFLLLISAIVIPLTALFFSLELDRYGIGLGLIALAALPGVAAAGTLFGSMTVRTAARDLLLAIVLFPLVSPTLLAAVACTRELFGGAPLAELGDYFRLMGVFDVVFIAGGVALFGTLVER